MKRMESLILSIETAIGCGSIALIRGSEVIAASGLETARANVLLVAIEKILKQTTTQIHEIAKLAVSLGPGSFTGIRVGLSTVLGLGRSLNIEVMGVSAFEAIASKSVSSSTAVLVPLGRRQFGCQFFGYAATGQIAEFGPFVVAEDGLAAHLASRHPYRVLVVDKNQTDLSVEFERLGIDFDMVADSHLAQVIGQFAATRTLSPPLDPIYLR